MRQKRKSSSVARWKKDRIFPKALKSESDGRYSNWKYQNYGVLSLDQMQIVGTADLEALQRRRAHAPQIVNRATYARSRGTRLMDASA
jgi:hypothetical protein